MYAQVFFNVTFFYEIYPMARKVEARIALKKSITNIVFPESHTIGGYK